jgi:hypothetical protein
MRYAIDVVILPPDPVADLSVAWNKRLSAIKDQSIVLDKTATMPHISLLMGCMSEAGLVTAQALMPTLLNRHQAMRLHVTGLQVTEGSHPVAALDIALSDPLARLQQDLIQTLKPVITQDAKETDLKDPPPIGASVLTWINAFIPEQCGDKFWPHITLGHGRPGENQDDFIFMATRIAICHLGNHCTCRSILWEGNLFPG